MQPQRLGALVTVALAVSALAGAGIALSVVDTGGPETTTDHPGNGSDLTAGSPTVAALSGETGTVEQFETRDAFQSYVAAGQRQTRGVYTGMGGVSGVTTDVANERAESADVPADAGDDAASMPSRVAETNVQVGTLDEPDRVKTDGVNFYYAPEYRRYHAKPRPQPDVEREEYRRPREPNTHVIDASDPEAPEAVSEINTSGQLLQTGDRLVVFEHDRIAGYDITDPENPTETWTHPLNGSMVTAREANGTVYLVTRSSVGPGTDCPIRPMGAETVACTDVYRPGTQIAADATYTAFSIDAAEGVVRDSVSFVGTADNSAIYMSPNALYVTYTERADRAALLGTFIREKYDRTPEHVDQRIAEIQSYNITTASKLREMRTTIRQWTASLPEDERREVRESFTEQLGAFLHDQRRNLTTTGIVRVGVDSGSLSVETTGTVPGEPLNQFSLDEHDGTLRITTTIPRTGSGDSTNDLYTLDATTLDRTGSVTAMGDDQRVYAVRYVEDTAYVVTYRQVDPLHVVDLSDPAEPVETGTLELPGYSSYLHPIDADTVLGIGEEDGKVKSVLFDVSDPRNPTSADSQVYDKRYSEISDTHHAFLIDRRHEVFVLPAGDAALAVDYTDGELTTRATIDTDRPVTRTRYVDESLYVFAGHTVTVVDETDWSTTTTLHLELLDDDRSD